jgi:glycosyltransferase involved in cell wall biosynthesis
MRCPPALARKGEVRRLRAGYRAAVTTRRSSAGSSLEPAAREATSGSARKAVVASVPSGHVYVRHLAPEDGTGPVRLTDPDPDERSRPAGQRWWPPVMLDPAWVADHAADVDLFHLHFGFDSRSETDLQSWVAALRRAGRPFVYTVHDLRNPHHETRLLHDRQLDVLVSTADRLLTLTGGAAAEIRSRWGREATVLPHPHVVPFGTMHAAQAMRDLRVQRGVAHPFTVGLHLKSVRASMAPERVLPVLADAVAELPEAVLRIDIHRDVMAADGLRHDAALARLLRTYADKGWIDLRVHDYFSDAELWRYLAGLDASVLPYRFGTHSGWLEACRDLGTTVIAPSCGYFAEQGPVLKYGHDEDLFDADSLHNAVLHVYNTRPDLGVSVEERRAQRRAVAAGHDLVYDALIRR